MFISLYFYFIYLPSLHSIIICLNFLFIFSFSFYFYSVRIIIIILFFCFVIIVHVVLETVTRREGAVFKAIFCLFIRIIAFFFVALSGGLTGSIRRPGNRLGPNLRSISTPSRISQLVLMRGPNFRG